MPTRLRSMTLARAPSRWEGSGQLLCALCLVVSACGEQPNTASGDTPVEEKTSALAAYPGATWDSNGDVVNICFINSGFASQKTLVQSTINSSWGANSGLRFVWPTNLATDLCPQSPAGSGNIPANYLPIWIKDAAGPGDWGGNCAPGYGARQTDIVNRCGGIATCQCMFSTAAFESNPSAYVAEVSTHEIGHGLGLPHEHQRIDRPSNISTTCVDLQNAPNANWNTDGDRMILPNLILLTQYDGLLSIMSYCRDFDQNGLIDFPPFSPLSPLDALGIEMMYPKNFGRKPVLGGFANADGSQFIVRSDLPTSLNVDWVTRGGLTSSLHNVQWWDSVLGGVFSTSPNPSVVIPTTRTIWVQLDDAFNRHHSWTATTAVPSNTRHTALVGLVAAPT
jgi:Astacin (Peptidase family M12A)